MGLLDVLNGMQNGPRGERTAGSGGMSPITMALLGLLAYKAVKHMSAGQAGAPAGVPQGSPNVDPQGGGLGGMLGGSLNDMLGNALGGGPAGGASGGGLGDLLKGGLGGLLAGGAAGGVLSGGLNDLLKQFQQGGQSDVANSWVGNGPNKAISPDDLAQVLGSDQIATLAAQSGLSRDELIAGLSQHLPDVVNHLTPQGRLPTEHEASRLI